MGDLKGVDPVSPAASTLSAGPRGLVSRVVWQLWTPTGVLGWVSSHWLLPTMSTPMYGVLADALRLSREDELLEVGCGSGAFLAEHAGHVQRVAGVDLSDMQVGLARARFQGRIAAGTADIVLGDAGTLPWPDDSFTVATSMAAFELFPDPEQVLAEVHRVLRPGGRAVITMGTRVSAGTQTHTSLGHWVWSEEDVQHLAEQAGFADIDIRYACPFGTGRVATTVSRLIGSVGSDLRLVTCTKP